jgi:hypothetical protein
MSGISPNFEFTQSRISSAAYGLGASINNLGNKIIKLSQGGWIDTFVRILTLFVSIYIIVVSSTNIAAYAYILRRNQEDPDISKTWCTALIVLNSLILVAAVVIMIFTIIEFFRKSSKSKKIALTSLQLNSLSAIQSLGDVVNGADIVVKSKASLEDIASAKAAGYDYVKSEYARQMKNLSQYQPAVFNSGQYSNQISPNAAIIAETIAANL